VGLQLPKRAAAPVRRLAMGALIAATLLFLSACDAADKDQIARLAMPEPATAQAPHTFELWKWSWVAAMITGIIVWGLIFWVVVKYRRRNDDEIPVQTRYNLPLEIFYTIAPIMMVIVFFAHTVRVQEAVLNETPEPDNCVQVVGQQWSWTFNYNESCDEMDGKVTYVAGTGSQIPTLVLEKGKTTQFWLSSPDVIHSFWITGFLMKMDIIPGQDGEARNHFSVTPDKVGDYRGKCTELCGVYHSRMLFNVKVMESADYDAYMAKLASDPEHVSDSPLLGGEHATTTAGFDADETETGGHE
jgi:cytochrome c oxidase subunit 2